jgi:hypothetical protein
MIIDDQQAPSELRRDTQGDPSTGGQNTDPLAAANEEVEELLLPPKIAGYRYEYVSKRS